MTIEYISGDGEANVINPEDHDCVVILKRIPGDCDDTYQVAKIVSPDRIKIFTTGTAYTEPDVAETLSREQINNALQLRGRLRWAED